MTGSHTHTEHTGIQLVAENSQSCCHGDSETVLTVLQVSVLYSEYL